MQWLVLQMCYFACKFCRTAVVSHMQSPCLLGSLTSVISSQSSFLSPVRPRNSGPEQGLSTLHLGLSPARKRNLQGHIPYHRVKEEAPLLSQASSQQEASSTAG